MDDDWLGEPGRAEDKQWGSHYDAYWDAYWDEWSRMLGISYNDGGGHRGEYCKAMGIEDLDIDECVQHAQANLEAFQRWAAVLRLTGEL